jgi:tetratricopeptide (TPR) repeat protein
LRLTRKAGESGAQRDARERNAKSLLDAGKDALENRRFPEAIEKLQQALDLSERNDYGNKPGEAAELLQAAKTGKANADAAARRAQVAKLVDDGKELVASDVVAANRKLREARNLDPQAPGLADLQNAVEQKARVEGEGALGSAKDLQNRRRMEEAEKAYERAVQLLELIPGGHKDLDFARKRLAELRR